MLSTNVSIPLLLHRSGYYGSEYFFGPYVLPDTLATEMYCNRPLDSLLNSWLRLIKWQPAVRTVLSHICYREVLTLRRLMSYIYMEHPFLMFLDHTQRRSTVGRTPLDE